MAKNMIEWDQSEATKKLMKQSKYLSSKEIMAAQVSAVNRAGGAARTRWTAEIRTVLGAKASAVNKAFEVSKAKFNKPAYTIKFRADYSIPLRDFARVRKAKGGVSAKMFRGKPSVLVPGAFIAPALDRQVLRRVGNERGPLKAIYGPSPKSQAEKTKHVAQERFQEVYSDRIEREIKFRIDKANK